MIGTKCPGQDTRYWTAADALEIKCPNCGEELEFFKTDIRLRCPKCKTKVANPKFNLGCAAWCVYAEQCIGSAARGLKNESLKNSLEEYLNTKLAGNPTERENIAKLLKKAEEVCQKQRLDMLPVLTALLAVRLKAIGVLQSETELLENLEGIDKWPEKAISDTEAIINNVVEGTYRSKNEKLVADLLKAYQADF